VNRSFSRSMFLADMHRLHFSALRELGTSLADIARFMYEVEIQQGLQRQGEDGRGIERLRSLALRMQHLPSKSSTVGTERCLQMDGY
jgi:hypothetical protein